MLSDKDYENYLNQIETIETAMRKKYEENALGVDDKELKSIFNTLAESETRHESIVRNLTKLFHNAFLNKT